MNETDFEAQVNSIASGMEYPLTPDIAGRVTARIHSSMRPRLVPKPLAWSLTIALILISSLLIIPPARAAILEFIQIGIVRILRGETAPTPAEVPATIIPLTATPSATFMLPLIPLLEDMAGELSLAEAQEQVDFQIRLPSYPADLGQPDHIFVQDADGDMVFLVWLQPGTPQQVRMSLHFIPATSWAIEKVRPTVIEETSVRAQRAIWTTGPYPIRLYNGDIQFMRMIEGHVLIWEEAGITYRLETEAALEEAIKIAESLQPLP